MKKSDLLAAINQLGVNGKFAARRIARSFELGDLPDRADITPALIAKWIKESPRLNGDLWNALSLRPRLSESDIRLINRVVAKSQGTVPFRFNPIKRSNRHGKESDDD
jgi:hypothetical protein